MFNRHEVKGKVEELKGRAKQAVADQNNDEELRQEGEAQELAGKIEGGFGTARRKAGNAIKDLGDAIKKP